MRFPWLRLRLGTVCLMLVLVACTSGDEDAVEDRVTADDATAAPAEREAPAQPDIDAGFRSEGDARGGNQGPSGKADPVRVGLHFTDDELETWRSRARNGPYRRQGDAFPGSPGDWNRITSSAKKVLIEDVADDVWKGPTRLSKRGCVRQMSGARKNNNPPIDMPSSVRDAAFVAMVTGDERYRTPVKHFLLAQSRKEGLDFSNRDLFCIGAMRDGSPGFDLANWLTKLLYAYDYMGPEAFSDGERQQLNDWFYDAAVFFADDVDRALEVLFADRASGDYTLTDIGSSTSDPRVGYHGSAPTYSLHRHYNNRKSTRVRYVAVAMQKLMDEEYRVPADDAPTLEELKGSATAFVEEWLMFSVFEEGWFGEFERWTEDEPDRGWTYAGDVLTPILTIAETFARAGDDRLYTFSTRAGALGTASDIEKDLLFAMESYAKYVDGTFERYGTDKAENVGQLAYRIDGVEDLDSDPKYGYHDVQMLIAQMLIAISQHEESYLLNTYLRQGPNRPGYRPEAALTVGQHAAWNGDWGTYPGVLFMFGPDPDGIAGRATG